MHMQLVADGEGRIWGGLPHESDAQWSPYKDLLGPLVRYDPMRRMLVSFSRGKLTRDWDDAVAERRTWLNVFEEYVVNNAQSN